MLSSSLLFNVCLKSDVIRNASILLALKNKGLTHKLEAYITVYGQTLISFVFHLFESTLKTIVQRLSLRVE